MPISVTLNPELCKVKLGRLAARGRNPRPLLDDLGERIHRSVMGNFASGGRPTKWKEVKKSKGGKILDRSSRLRNSIRKQVSGRQALVGTNVKYAKVHQYGHTFPPMTIRPRRARALKIPTGGGGFVFRKSATIPERTVPARPFLLIQPEDEKYIQQAVQDYFGAE